VQEFGDDDNENASGGLSWQDGSTRAHDVYVHIADQTALNARIEQLLSAR
jgi:hypothetical protein